MEYVSIGAANAPATPRGSATRGSATCGCGVGAVGARAKGCSGRVGIRCDDFLCVRAQ